MVKIRFIKNGFTLVEVLTATIVMSMMMMALFGYLQYGMEIWKLGKNKFDAINYARMVFDLIGDDIFNASRVYQTTPVSPLQDLWLVNPILADTLVTDPPSASATNTLFLVRQIKCVIGQPSRVCFQIYRDPLNDCLFRTTSDAGIEMGTLHDPINLINNTRYDKNRWEKIRIARNVMSFKVTRMSQQTLRVELVFGEDTDSDGLVDLETSRHDMTFLAPQLQGVP